LSAETCTSSVSPPIAFDDDLMLQQVGRTFSGLAPGLSILLIATMIGTLRRPGVVDRLDRLRHDAVVGRHHQDDDVRRLGAAGAHRREGGVARRVDEGDLLAVLQLDLIGADVLRDAAGLADTTLVLRIASSSDVLPWST
jgi:hypothetical protein